MSDQTLEDDTHNDDKEFSRWVWRKEDKNMDLQVKQDFNWPNPSIPNWLNNHVLPLF